MSCNWKCLKTGENVIVVEMDLTEETGWALLVSDLHWDNPHCNRKLLAKHFDEAVERNAPILSIGDFFCAMQGKYDKRSSKECVRPEHQKDHYLDALVDTAAEWLEPYKHHFLLFGNGNHETKIKQNHETDLGQRLVTRLQHTGGVAHMGGYAGFVRFCLRRLAQKKAVTLFYHHGHGGGSGINQGSSHFNYYNSYVNADILAAGHVHRKELRPQKKVELNRSHNVEQKDMYFVRMGSYKDEYGTGAGGWPVEKGQGPRPLGGWWLKFNRTGHDFHWHILEAER